MRKPVFNVAALQHSLKIRKHKALKPVGATHG